VSAAEPLNLRKASRGSGVGGWRPPMYVLQAQRHAGVLPNCMGVYICTCTGDQDLRHGKPLAAASPASVVALWSSRTISCNHHQALVPCMPPALCCICSGRQGAIMPLAFLRRYLSMLWHRLHSSPSLALIPWGHACHELLTTWPPRQLGKG
jgi:hypothetical protein